MHAVEGRRRSQKVAVNEIYEGKSLIEVATGRQDSSEMATVWPPQSSTRGFDGRVGFSHQPQQCARPDSREAIANDADRKAVAIGVHVAAVAAPIAWRAVEAEVCARHYQRIFDLG